MTRKTYVKTDFDNLSIKEACGIADVSRMTILRWMRDKKFTFEKKVNGYVLIDKESFFQFIKEKKGEGGYADTEDDKNSN